MIDTRAGGFGLQSVQMLGIINALKTGDATIDTMIAMILPLVLSFALTQLRRHSTTLWEYFMRKKFRKCLYSRLIVYRTSHTVNGVNSNLDDDSYNRYLIKGIKLYVHYHCKLKFDDAELELTEGIGGEDDDEEEDEGKRVQRAQLGTFRRNNNHGNTSTASLLTSCQVVKKPVQQNWHDVGTFGGSTVRMWIRDTIVDSGGGDNGGTGGKNTRNLELRLESNGKDSIDEFVNTAYRWYTKEMKKLENNHRYLYDLKMFDGRAEHKTPHYNRFRLGEEKSFDSLFSQQTKSLVKIVDDFQQRKGKFGIPGFPYKLGLLLYGPPGTGKTSLIKALAKHTKRHIVNIPLARITTNQELTAMFFNKLYNCAGHTPARLGFKNVIFVLEDVDATSEVVTRRKPLKAKKSSRKKKKRATIDIEEKFDQLDMAVEEAELNGDEDAVAEAMKIESQLLKFQAAQNKLKDDQDKLSLAGLLNALDGVVDTPGRIVIMTTNYPELLDPALVRPGRIDKLLKLGFMLSEDVVDMLAHYFRQELSIDQKARVRNVLDGGVEVTPAQVEQLILEKDSVEDIVKALELRRTVGDSISSFSSTEDETLCEDDEEELIERNPKGKPAIALQEQ